MSIQVYHSAKKGVGILLLRNPYWRVSRGRRLARLAVFACFLYVASLLTLLALEDRLLFPGASISRAWREAPEYLHVRELVLPTSTGDKICAWFTAPDSWEPGHGAVIISHGNGHDISKESGRAFRWRESLGRAVLFYDYPGYGKSSGRPSESGCYAAGEAAFQWLVQEQAVPEHEIVLVGESLGGAIAVELATRHCVRLLVLQGAFTSFPDMAQHRLPWYPSRYLVHNRMENEAKMPQVRCPALITHGTADSVVPFAQGERLFAAARAPKLLVRLEGHRHAPPSTKEYFKTVQSFLAQTAGAGQLGSTSNIHATGGD